MKHKYVVGEEVRIRDVTNCSKWTRRADGYYIHITSPVVVNHEMTRRFNNIVTIRSVGVHNDSSIYTLEEFNCSYIDDMLDKLRVKNLIGGKLI